MLLKINDKRESSIKILKDVYGRQEIPDFKAHVKKGINGIVNIEEANGLNGYIYMINAIFYDRIENQYLLDISDENIEKLTKDFNIKFMVNIHSYEDSDLNVSIMFPKNYFTIDIVDIKPKRFVDVKTQRFGVRVEELEKVDTMSIPNEILDACDLLSEKYNKINIELNSENTIAEISVERNDGREVGVKFISNDIGVYGKIEKDVQFILFNRSTSSNTYDFFPVYVEYLLPKDIINLKEMEDRIYDLCSSIIYNHNESK